MEKGVIHAIIEVEKEIQKKIKAEELRSRNKIEKVRKEIDGFITGEEERLKEELKRAIEAAGEEAERNAEKMVADAVALAAQIEGLDDKALEKIILKHINRILPEG
jgi:uncharacterized protein YbjQ (UPF0145 family)